MNEKGSLAYVAAAILVAGVLVSATLILVPVSRSPTTVTQASVTATTLTTTLTETTTSTETISSTSSLSTSTVANGAPFGALGKWNMTSSYPFDPIGVSCVASDGLVYCVGGYDWNLPQFASSGVVNRTYYASLSPSGVGPWTASTPYPLPIMDESCVASLGYIYCVGGIEASVNQGCVEYGGSTSCGNSTNSAVNSYYAPLTPSGISQWLPTTSYPSASVPQCTLAFAYILCVGTRGSDAGVTDFAPLTSQGIGNWTRSNTLPPTQTGCVTTDSNAYCFDGDPCNFSGYCGNDTAYYAPILDSGGVGPWVATSSTLSSSSTADTEVALGVGPYVYYMSDPPQFATSIPNGLGAWTQTGSEPSDDPQSCVTSGIYIYCVGGWLESHGTTEILWTNDVYFYQVELEG